LRDIDRVARRCLGVLALSTYALAPAAAAQTSGGGGGGVYVAQPKITKVTCVSKCATHKRARGGSKLNVTGTGLGSADELVFHGSFGKDDDLAASVHAGSDSRVSARVPLGAVTGPLSVETSAGGESKPTQPVDRMTPGHRASRPAPAAPVPTWGHARP
jgi:hypothetical protein